MNRINLIIKYSFINIGHTCLFDDKYFNSYDREGWWYPTYPKGKTNSLPTTPPPASPSIYGFSGGTSFIFGRNIARACIR